MYTPDKNGFIRVGDSFYFTNKTMTDQELSVWLAQQELFTTDAGMARVIEDMFDMLLAKGAITKEDIARQDPSGNFQAKLDKRKQLRAVK